MTLKELKSWLTRVEDTIETLNLVDTAEVTFKYGMIEIVSGTGKNESFSLADCFHGDETKPKWKKRPKHERNQETTTATK